MKKKTLILLISVLSVSVIAFTSVIIILVNHLTPKKNLDADDLTGALVQNESDKTDKPEKTDKKKPVQTVESIEITKVYEFSDEFEAPEYKQNIYRDEKSGITLPYCIIEPKNYSPDKKYPVLLYLHGAGETGTDNVAPVLTMQDAFIVNGDLLKDVIIVCPQSTSWWDADRVSGDKKGPVGAAVRLLDSLGKTYSIDKNRIYVLGISMGGYGTWNALSHFPDTFAAGIPICGGGNSSYADVLVDTPIWIYHGTADDIVPFAASENMYDAIKALGGNKIHFTRLQGVGHSSWTPALADRELFNWLLSQDKAKNPSGKYTAVPNYKIVDENGNTVITDKDAENPYFYYYKEVNVLAQFKLTDEGFKKLKDAYARGGEFTLFHGNQKLFSFRPTGVEPEQQFKADVTYNGEN